MRQVHTPLRRVMAAGTLLAAAYALGGLPAMAQDATTSTSTSTSADRIKVPRTTATPQMIDEAVQRSKARFKNFVLNGKPEQWGSEEPFVPTQK
jgi:hypothetical protein